MTFEDIEKIRQSGALHGKLNRQAARRAPPNSSTQGGTGGQLTATAQESAGVILAGKFEASEGLTSPVLAVKRFQRVNKNRPVEASSKKRPKKLQDILQVIKP